MEPLLHSSCLDHLRDTDEVRDEAKGGTACGKGA